MKFEKVTYEEFARSIKSMARFEFADDEDIRKVYDEIKLPERSTSGSAGYDFFSPIGAVLASFRADIEQCRDDFTEEMHDIVNLKRDEIIIPTGIKAQIDPHWVLILAPRSGQGFNYGVALANTIGVIDEDYYNNEKNEGHIMVKLTSTSTEFDELYIRRGKAFCQGIFLPYGLTDDDKATAKRTGGLGSTGV